MVLVLGASTPNLARHPKASVIWVTSSICLEKLTRGERPGVGKISAVHSRGPASWTERGTACLACAQRLTTRCVGTAHGTKRAGRWLHHQQKALPLCRRRYHLRTAYYNGLAVW